MTDSHPMSLLKSFNDILSDEKDESNTLYINIKLLCNSLWKTNDFDFTRDIENKIPTIFWSSTNTIQVFSNPVNFLDGSYCDFVLAKKILRFLVTREKVFLPVHWKKLTTILPYFELEYIQKNIREYKEPFFTPNKKITNESYRHTALGKVEIFPIQKSIPMLLRDIQKINFYDPLEYLNVTYPNFLDNRGTPLFVNINDKQHFFKILDEKNILVLPENLDNVGLNRKIFLLDSFRFQELISFFGNTNVHSNSNNYCSKNHFASYKKLIFELNDTTENNIKDSSQSDNELQVEHKIDLNNVSDLYLLTTKSKLLTSHQRELRLKLKQKIYYKNRNNNQVSELNIPSLSSENVVIKQVVDLENTNDLYLLNTKPKLLSPTQKKLRLNLKKRINYKNKNIPQESKLKIPVLSAEEIYLLKIKPRFLSPPQTKLRLQLKKNILREQSIL